MMNQVMQRPMFAMPVRRETGTPEGGETTSTTRVMEGPIDSFKFNLLDRLGVISNKTFNPDVPDQDFQINIDDAMASPQLLNDVFNMVIQSTGFDLDAFMNMGGSQQQDYLNTIKGKLIFGKAEGGEMKSDAVGIADGLDQEEPMSVDRDPSKEGIAKVSPEQYVQLMNEVRGDNVPLDGRVQELAMTVGEKDATDTPLSVLALVQPVFEMREQQGIAQAQQGQQMMQQGPMPMASGGIVHLAEGPGEEGVYSGMVGPLSEEQIANFGLFTKPQMSDLGVASYTTGAGDVIEAGSPESVLFQLTNMVKPKTFAEILEEKKSTIGNLGLFEGQKDALKLPFLSGVTQFGLDVARGDNVVESALNRFNQATSTALPMAMQIKSQEKQLPLQLALSEYSNQATEQKEMKKFILGKSFDLALENQKNKGIGTVGVVGENNDVINKAFGSNVTDSLPIGTIVQKNSSGLMTTIKPDQFDVKNLVTITGSYIDKGGKKITVNTIVDVSTADGLAEFDRLMQFKKGKASELIFSPFIDTQPDIKLNT